ncbi:hypothetical protein LTR95_003157 [Oleoguttula sp. CCFEE 5521]
MHSDVNTTTVEGSPTRSLVALPEILEAILLHIPTRDLPRLQRVSKHWQRTILTSPLLRTALFLPPPASQSPGEKHSLLQVSYPVRAISPALSLPIEATAAEIVDHIAEGGVYLNPLVLPQIHHPPSLALRRRFEQPSADFAAMNRTAMWLQTSSFRRPLGNLAKEPSEFIFRPFDTISGAELGQDDREGGIDGWREMQIVSTLGTRRVFINGEARWGGVADVSVEVEQGCRAEVVREVLEGWSEGMKGVWWGIWVEDEQLEQ